MIGLGGSWRAVSDLGERDRVVVTRSRISPTVRVTLARRCSTTFRSVPVTSLAPPGIVRVWTASDAVGYGVPGGDDKLAIELRADARAPGAGFHVAFAAPDCAAVDAFHREAITNGGTDDGARGYDRGTALGTTLHSLSIPMAITSRQSFTNGSHAKLVPSCRDGDELTAVDRLHTPRSVCSPAVVPIDPVRILRPERVNLARALAVTLDVREAVARTFIDPPGHLADNSRLPTAMRSWTLWAKFAARGVIPKAWACASDRYFERIPSFDYYEARKGPRFALPHSDPHPPTLRACISIASDVRGILAAEEAVRARFGVHAARIVWRMVEGHAAGAIRGGHVMAIRNGKRHSPSEARMLSLGYAVYSPLDDATVLIAPLV